MLTSVYDWLEKVSGNKFIWFVKRLSGNDTLANGSHQAGPYINKEFLFKIFPSMKGKTNDNQKHKMQCFTDSHDCKSVNICVTWYNNKYRIGTRDEARFTNFGGKNSPILDPDSTGALAVFAFERDSETNQNPTKCYIWVARDATEENIIEDRIGPIEPGKGRISSQDLPLVEATTTAPKDSCWLSSVEMPEGWLIEFPTGAEIIKKAIELCQDTDHDLDKRLIKRRVCEYELFQSIEEAIELPQIKKGFLRVEDFIKKAQTVLQRRKSRAGRSLELHVKEILLEEGLRDGENFSYQPTCDNGNKPDFIFPSLDCYNDSTFPDNNLRMLAVKTTCKDRWRQVLQEAERVETKHLLTLQEGISHNQFQEMQQSKIQLVVPSRVISKFSSGIKPHLQTLKSFVEDVKELY